MWNEFAHALIALANNYFDRIAMTRAIFWGGSLTRVLFSELSNISGFCVKKAQ